MLHFNSLTLSLPSFVFVAFLPLGFFGGCWISPPPPPPPPPFLLLMAHSGQAAGSESSLPTVSVSVSAPVVLDIESIDQCTWER